MSLLAVDNLQTHFRTRAGTVRAVDGLSFTLDRGRALGIVGESGSGKTVTSLSIMRLLEAPGFIAGGRVLLDGQDMVSLSEREIRAIRGRRICLVFQDPMTALNPVYRVGDQIVEAMQAHAAIGHAAALERTTELFRQLGIPAPEQRIHEYPHQLSGGMRQRVTIAMALVNEPELLILDEPTTALDVTIQAQILDLIRGLRHRVNTAVLLITHDIGVVEEVCDEVLVMYGGRVMEWGTVAQVTTDPKHPLYARASGVDPDPGQARHAARRHCWQRAERAGAAAGLPVLAALRTGDAAMQRRSRPAPARRRAAGRLLAVLMSTDPLLEIRDLRTYYKPRGSWSGRGAWVKAVDGVSLSIGRGETFGLVGESGCGKSTLGRSILRLTQPQSGQILFDGQDLLALPSRQLKRVRQDIQAIFQDPFGSLDPRMTVRQQIGEGLIIQGLLGRDERDARIEGLIDRVGLGREHLDRYPHEFSGGQRQRIGIARALALRPKFILADEPVSALDVSVQSQVLNLLAELQREFGLTYLFIAHDLAVVEYISDRVGVMYLGRLVEVARAEQLYDDPRMPYTQALLSATPGSERATGRKRIVLTGDVPSPLNPPSGCPFRTRCWLAEEICHREVPVLKEVEPEHFVACHFADDKARVTGAAG